MKGLIKLLGLKAILKKKNPGVVLEYAFSRAKVNCG